ncbi:hypothetical protein AGMMS50229_12210 [Campylobacterota bacterium]|nr:hypothetical protein AGMMS50229_12210 [Campylobacterota bacterium]
MEAEQIRVVVSNFMDHFFGDELTATQKELDFVDANGFETPKLDYIKMRRFLVTAHNNLKTIDPHINEGLLSKIHQDVERLHEYVAEFNKKTKMGKLVYIRDFLPSVPEYKALQDEVTINEAMKKRFQSIAASTDRELATIAAPKNAEELAYIKTLRKRNVDAIDGLANTKDKLVIITKELKDLEDSMTAEFFLQYNDYVINIRDGLREVIQTKSFYFDKVLWERAEHSQLIQKFFAQARIEGDYSTKTFIQYYLRNIDINKSNTSDWHLYLQEVLRVLE